MTAHLVQVEHEGDAALRKALRHGIDDAALACWRRQHAQQGCSLLARTCDEGVHGAPKAGAHGRHRSSSVSSGRRLGALACVAVLL
jgi:hypothetical protein